MKKIVAAVAVNGSFIEKSDNFDDYPFPRLLDFKEDELVISNYYKMKTKDYRDSLVTIPYKAIEKIELRIVRRFRGQRITGFDGSNHFDLHISTNGYDEWDVETLPNNQLIECLQSIGELDDVAKVIDHLKSDEDFNRYCDDNYDSWVKELGFEEGRIAYSDRNL